MERAPDVNATLIEVLLVRVHWIDWGRRMRTPTFSVIIPCYNVAGTIEETVASVSAQTQRDLEIICLDNNSTDSTAAVLAGIAKREPRLRVIHQPRQGLCATRNKGIAEARGRYLAFLDGDDLFDADYLELHEANLASGEVGVSYGRVRLVDMQGRPTGNVTQPPMQGLEATDLLRSNPCTMLVVVRREVPQKAGLFDETLRRVEDQEWLFRVAHAGFVFRGIDRAIASYRITPGGLSHDIDRMLEGHGQMLDAASRVAPQLVAAHARLSRAAMLRYCARRAVDHEAGGAAARSYLWAMLRAGPDLLVREPVATAKTIVAVLAPGLTRGLLVASPRAQSGRA